MLTAEQVRNVFENVPPEKWAAAVQSMFVELTGNMELLHDRQERLLKGTVVLAKEVRVLRGGKVSEAPAKEAPVSDAGPDVSANVDISTVDPVSASGEMRTKEEMANEAIMNAAIDAAEAEKAGKRPEAPRPPQPANGQQQKQKKRPVASAQSHFHAPGDPQSAIENQMDQAIAAMEK